MSEADIRAERLKKLKALADAGMEAYPAQTRRDTSVADFLKEFEEGGAAVLAGRIMSRRGQGGIVFADLHDGTGRTQLVLQADGGADIKLFDETVDVGDFVEFSGSAFTTKRGQPSLNVSSWRMLAKSLLPIPGEWYGLKDEELVLRQRYLDILLNDEVRQMFERRARFWQAIRAFYLARGFLEVETPTLETLPGGADARPFTTHHHALDMEVHLRIALELWHKRLLVAGFPKVFEIGRIFRNEGQSREHLQDFSLLESYEAFSDVEKGMDFARDLYRHVANEVYKKYTFTIGDHEIDLADDWETVDFSEVMQKHYNLDPIACSEKEAIAAARDAEVEFGKTPNKARAVDHLWKKIRKTITGPAFLTGVPIYLSPLAKRSEESAAIADRLQIIIAGSEVGNGYSELNDPQDQRKRFEEQEKLRAKGDEEAQRLDEEYLRAMEYGMPPAFGFGVSERLFAFLENKPAHEAQLFPLLRPRG